MFSGTEWLVMGPMGAMVLLGVAALVVWAVVRLTRGRGPSLGSTARVRGDADDVLRDLQLATAGLSNTVTRRETADSLTAERTYLPGWAIVVAIIAFPFGLIALIARSSVTGTVIASQEADGIVVLRMAGCFDRTAVRAINSVIEFRSQLAPTAEDRVS